MVVAACSCAGGPAGAAVGGWAWRGCAWWVVLRGAGVCLVCGSRIVRNPAVGVWWAGARSAGPRAVVMGVGPASSRAAVRPAGRGRAVGWGSGASAPGRLCSGR